MSSAVLEGCTTPGWRGSESRGEWSGLSCMGSGCTYLSACGTLDQGRLEGVSALACLWHASSCLVLVKATSPLSDFGVLCHDLHPIFWVAFS